MRGACQLVPDAEMSLPAEAQSANLNGSFDFQDIFDI